MPSEAVSCHTQDTIFFVREGSYTSAGDTVSNKVTVRLKRRS